MERNLQYIGVTASPNAAPLPHHVTVVATTSMIHSTDLGIFKLVMPHHVTVVATASMIHSTDLGIFKLALSISALLFVSRLVFSSLYVLVLVVLD